MLGDQGAARRSIGYYVHHQGHGHLARARAIQARLGSRCTLIGTLPEDDTNPAVLRLPDDRISVSFSGADGESSRPNAFHYAPLDAANVRARMALLAAWIAQTNPACLIVDVSCEIALFARLMSVPVVLVRLAGRRTDTPHLEAFRAAEALIAPFPAEFDDRSMPEWVRDKTTYVGFIGGLRPPSAAPAKPRSIALVLGQGGASVQVGAIVAAARATPTWDWQVYGPIATSGELPANLAFYGWCADLGSRLSEADVVVGGCGDGLLADVAAHAKRFICLPEDRAFDEQRSKARHLARHRMAVVLEGWPMPAQWPGVLEDACAIDPSRLASRHDPSAADKAAAVIETLIAGRARQNGRSGGTR